MAGIARVKTAWVEQKARVGRTAKQVDSKSSPPEKSVPSSTHLLRLVADALDLQAEDLKPWTEFESLGNRYGLHDEYPNHDFLLTGDRCGVSGCLLL